MAKKPQPRRELAVINTFKETRYVFFNSSQDALNDIRQFGFIDICDRYYILQVDARYDFNEVLEYMKNYG